MSSPITLSGFNNIDFKSIINLIMEAERQKITRVQAQQKIEQVDGRPFAQRRFSGVCTAAFINATAAQRRGTLSMEEKYRDHSFLDR